VFLAPTICPAPATCRPSTRRLLWPVESLDRPADHSERRRRARAPNRRRRSAPHTRGRTDRSPFAPAGC